jgi:hypothetical protein
MNRNFQNSNNGKQISGMEPNYTYNGAQNLTFNTSSIPQSGFTNNQNLQQNVYENLRHANNYNAFAPVNTFQQSMNNNSRLENMKNYEQYSIEKNFQQHTPIQTMLDTQYTNNTLYNNINKNILKENVTEIRLNIDSADRDVNSFPDPFSYIVSFGPNNYSDNDAYLKRAEEKLLIKKIARNNNFNNVINTNNTNTNNTNNNNNTNDIYFVDYSTKVKKTFNPNIIRNFTNVKYVRLDNIVLPKYSGVGINKKWDFFNTNTTNEFIRDDYDRIRTTVLNNFRYIPIDTNIESCLYNDRFIQVKIKELNNNENLATNNITSNSFTIYPDKSLGILYWRGNPYYAVKTFLDSLLGRIDKLTIEFYDSWGKQITLDTSSITYETQQILKTNILIPNLPDLSTLDYNFLINSFREIIKTFVIINSNIDLTIPFYSNTSNTSTAYTFNPKCINTLLTINFPGDNIYEDLNQFVSPGGFIVITKHVNGITYNNISIDDYINNVFFYNSTSITDTNATKVINNLNILNNNYNNFGYAILDKLKTDIINLSSVQHFQNNLTFVMGVCENEFSTKIDYGK